MAIRRYFLFAGIFRFWSSTVHWRRGFWVGFVLLGPASEIKLQSAPPAQEEPQKSDGFRKVTRNDMYGDALPEGALARFGTTYLKTDFNEIAVCKDCRQFYTWARFRILRVH